ncbi:MAG: ATP-dependent DNA helicase RecG [Elusimicrobia bacterium]|nr:MAG: ATP-dependent DNA helicase RecG [Elusimicrobiota bacterium]
MNAAELKLLIAEGEGLTVEFKEKYTPRIDRDIVAMVNSSGGFILLGVSDDRRVTGEKLTNQMKAEISSLARNCDPHVPMAKISQDGMTQKMTQKEVRLVFRAAADRSFESLPCKGFSPENVQLSAVRDFLKETGADLKVNRASLPSFLSSLGLHDGGGVNNAGALMFAADINRFIPHSETIMAAFKGVDKVHIYDRLDARADLLSQFNAAMGFLKKHLNVRSEIYIDRTEIYELPLEALREAVVNALVHRDYSVRGTSIYVNIFDDRVDISNPGGLLPGVTTRNFGTESVRRNPVIADLFHRIGKVERLGTGIRRMKGLMREAGLKAPVFTSDTFFHAVFHRDPKYSLKRAGEKTVEKSSVKSSVKILSLLSAMPSISAVEVSGKIGLTLRAVEKAIAKLKAAGKIRRIGPDKGGRWEVL